VTSPGYFDDLYARSPDPWHLTSSDYEARKYAVTADALPTGTGLVHEPGCSVGVLTAALATRCRRLVAWDLSPVAVAAARERVAGHPHVEVHVGAVPGWWAEGRPDVVVLSELLYYLSDDDRRRTLDAAAGRLAPGGHLLAVHWRHPFAEAPTDGDAVHDALLADPRWRPVDEVVDPDYRLALLRVAPADVP
jgi:SAM-dependent methyltransferase